MMNNDDKGDFHLDNIERKHTHFEPCPPKYPKKFSPLRGEKGPKINDFRLSVAPLGAPDFFCTFCHPFASFSFILRAT